MTEQIKKTNVLATFKIPTGLSTAEIIFTGEGLEPEDFDTLGQYIPIFKKSYERRLAAQEKTPVLNTKLQAAPLEGDATSP